MIQKRDIRKFRSVLRQLERTVELQNKSCCPQVTSAQCHVLLQIDEDKETTVSDLAGTLHLDASTVSRTVDGLVRAKLVKRAENPADRRSIVLHTTDKGRKLCNDINSEADAFFAKKINRIPAKEWPAVLKSFETLVRALSDPKHERRQSSACCDCGKG